MANTIQGNTGNCSLPSGFGGKISAWMAKLNIDNVDTTGFTDSPNPTNAATGLQMTGSAVATGLSGAATTNPVPVGLFPITLAPASSLTAAMGTVTLTAATGKTYSFTALVTGVKQTRKWDGKLEITFDFKSSGVITQAWA